MRRSMSVIGAAVLLAVSGTSLSAQMIMGVKGGANLTNVAVTADGSGISTSMRQAFHGGLLLGFGLKPSIAVEFSMLYVGKGFEPDSSASDGALGRLTIDYYEFPLLAVGTFPADPSFLAGRVFAGPSFALRARCNLRVPDQDPTGWTDCDADISSAIDFGVMAGAGVKLGKGLGGLTVDVGYDYGLSNIVKGNTGTSGKNRGLMITVGYTFVII